MLAGLLCQQLLYLEKVVVSLYQYDINNNSSSWKMSPENCVFRSISRTGEQALSLTTALKNVTWGY